MEYLGVISRGVNRIGRPAGISRPRFRHAPRWKKPHGRSPYGSPPHVCFPPTSITFDQGERLQEATSDWTSSMIAPRNGFDCHGSFLLYIVEFFAQLSSSLSIAVAESHSESVASAFASWVLRERNLRGFRRRREQRHSRPRDRPVPQ